MIVVVSPEATPSDIDAIVARIEQTGHQAHISQGTERCIIGVIGQQLSLSIPMVSRSSSSAAVATKILSISCGKNTKKTNYLSFTKFS